MVQTLVFKKSLIVKDLENTNPKPKANEIVWCHLIKNEDKVIDTIVHDINHEDEEEEFKEDLIENQRPGLQNFSNFTFLNISMTNKDMYNPDIETTGLVQLTFIIKRNKIFSIANRKSTILSNIIENMKKTKLEDFSTTCIISYILEDLVEYGIDVTEKLKRKIDKLQKTIIESSDIKEINKTYERLENLKEKSFYASKTIRADIELLKYIYKNKGKFIAAPQFDSHLEDRFLYCQDLLETQRDALNGTYNLYMAAQSNNLNRQMYKLSWIAALLVIPTIVSGFFGMNVNLPLNNFWIIALFTIALSVFAAIWIRK